jgi:hypothetical protein
MAIMIIEATGLTRVFTSRRQKVEAVRGVPYR